MALGRTAGRLEDEEMPTRDVLRVCHLVEPRWLATIAAVKANGGMIASMVVDAKALTPECVNQMREP